MHVAESYLYDAPKPRCPLTTRQPAEYSRMSGNPTPLTKIGQSLLCIGSSTQEQHVPTSISEDIYMSKNGHLGPYNNTHQYTLTINHSFKS